MRKSPRQPWAESTRIPIYGGKLWLAVGPSIWEASRRLPRPLQRSREAIEGAVGLFICSGKDTALVFEPGHLTHSTIAHEVGHHLFYSAGYFGLAAEAKHDEALCYLLGWVTDWVYGQLAAHRMVVKPREPQ